MSILRWLIALVLLWGLFIGIAFLLAPLFAGVRGTPVTSIVGVGLIGFCGWGLLRVQTRLGRHRTDP